MKSNHTTSVLIQTYQVSKKKWAVACVLTYIISERIELESPGWSCFEAGWIYFITWPTGTFQLNSLRSYICKNTSYGSLIFADPVHEQMNTHAQTHAHVCSCMHANTHKYAHTHTLRMTRRANAFPRCRCTHRAERMTPEKKLLPHTFQRHQLYENIAFFK